MAESQDSEPQQPESEKNTPLAVVGIVASAGGLAAFKQFLEAVPASTGLAFILVPHLDPSHKSLMVELLARYSALPVREVVDGMTVTADHAYVIPPGSYLTISAGTLKLTAIPQPASHQTGIDLFLRSLAEAYNERAIGIVLSGTGSHGTTGLRAIKAHDGLTLVQDPGTAEYEQMPQSVVDTELADFVLEPKAMPSVLVDYATNVIPNSSKVQLSEDGQSDELMKILALLRTRTRYDFRAYRKNMLLRRIQRRMGICYCNSLAEYLQRMRDDEEEPGRLYRDLLIGVTSFFRDPEAYKVLEQHIIAPLAERADPDTPIRVWVPACSTGEEVYSIAILFLESFNHRQQPLNLQIFATDIDEAALETARQGRYPESAVAEIPAERRQRFFYRSESHYCVNKQLREAVVFAPQNLITNAPFSRLDLISCRNLLIYLEPDVQQKIITLFHFALNDDGYLFLGSSESVGRQTDLFKTVSKKWRLFQRTGATPRNLIDFPLYNSLGHSTAAQESVSTDSDSFQKIGFAELARRVLLEDYAPAAVLVNSCYEILYYYGPTMNYLALPTGEPTRDLMSMAREGLRGKLRAACYKALRERITVRLNNTSLLRKGQPVPVEVQVRPLPVLQDEAGLLLVTFRDCELSASRDKDERPGEATIDELTTVQQLESELRDTRDDLQNTIEEMESANEELKISNEEVMSMNEELQSTNEELETSKEELQSLNEELSTVNSQLKDKVEELEQSNNDITNLLTKTDISTVFLDPHLNIKLFTPPAAHLFNLRSTDVDRPISDFSPNFSDDRLLADAAAVLSDQVPREREVRTQDENYLVRRILPYRTQDDRIDGAVITFLDITARVQGEQALRNLNQELEQRVTERTQELQRKSDELQLIADNVPSLYSYVDANEVHRYVNRLYKQHFDLPAAQIIGRTVHEIMGPDNYAIAEPHIRAVLASQPQHFEKTFNFNDRQHIMDVMYEPDHTQDGNVRGFYVLAQDITDRRTLELALTNSQSHLAAIIDAAADGIITVDTHGLIRDFNPAAERMFDQPAEDIVGRDARQILAPTCQPCEGYPVCFLSGNCLHNSVHPQELSARHRDGSLFPVEITSSDIDHLGLTAVLIRDISQRRQLEREVIDASTLEQARIGREIHDGIGQQLTAISMLAMSIRKKLAAAGHEEAALEIDRLAEYLEVSHRQSHRLAQGLAPVEIDPAGLSDALQQLAKDTQKTCHVECFYHVSTNTLVHDNDTALHLYRIAQEAINNAVKHGQPQRINILLSRTDHTLELTIQDDGTGIQETGERQGRLGLHLMRYRASIISGELRVMSLESGGTRVNCTIPLV